MIFGTTQIFAIEIGSVETYPETPGLYVQFRFWVSNNPVGDWNDRIPLLASIENSRTILETESIRGKTPFGQSLTTEVFKAVYDDFFFCDYTPETVIAPNLRDRFHLDEIGMGAIQDKYGIVLAASSNDSERVIVKDLRQDRFIADIVLPRRIVEEVLSEYIAWGREQLNKPLP